MENKENVGFENGIKLDASFEKHLASGYRLEEFVDVTAPVTWAVKPRENWRKFQIYNQNGSGSCVAMTMRKLIAILYWLKTNTWIDPSASHIYQRRVNKPDGGMGGDDVFKIAQQGVALNYKALSDNMTNAQMDAVVVSQEAVEEGKQYAIKNWLLLPVGDIDTLASTIETTKKGVMMWTFWNYDEWLDVPVVKRQLNLYAESTSRHSTAAVDFTLCDQSNMPNNPETWGKKCIIMDESWDKTATALDGQRVITEDFFKQRNFYLAYPINFKFEQGVDPNKPKHTFPTNRIMKYRPGVLVTYGDADVIAMQDILKYEGFFPLNLKSTGYFGTYTKTALAKWQKKHGLKDDGIAGKNTLGKMNSIYSA